MTRGDVEALFGVELVAAALADPVPLPALSVGAPFAALDALLQRHRGADLPTVRPLVAALLAALSEPERLAVVRLTYRGADDLLDAIEDHESLN